MILRTVRKGKPLGIPLTVFDERKLLFQEIFHRINRVVKKNIGYHRLVMRPDNIIEQAQE